MSVNPYPNIEATSDFQVYEFLKAGKNPKKKRVRFDLIDDGERICNVALCTIMPNGNEDCESASRNEDMDYVLETTAESAIQYLNRFPQRKLFIRGSDPVRSRKYQIDINKYLDMVIKDFIIEGLLIKGVNNTFLREPFQKGKNYDGFIFSLTEK